MKIKYKGSLFAYMTPDNFLEIFPSLKCVLESHFKLAFFFLLRNVVGKEQQKTEVCFLDEFLQEKNPKPSNDLHS